MEDYAERGGGTPHPCAGSSEETGADPTPCAGSSMGMEVLTTANGKRKGERMVSCGKE